MPNPYPGDSLQRLQDELLDLLTLFDGICRDLGLTYFIDSGTALGAGRHGGFIPWDDDADVGMPLEDYRRLLQEAPAALPAGYSLHIPQTNPEGPELWCCLWKDGTRFVDDTHAAAGSDQAIFLDIFPFVPLERDPNKADAQVRRLYAIQWARFLQAAPLPDKTAAPLRVVSQVAHAVLQLVPRSAVSSAFEKAMVAADPGDRWVSACYPKAGNYATDVLFPPQPVPFAGTELMAPRNLEVYLDHYGDWRTPPPPKKRYIHAPQVLDFGDGVNVMEPTSRKAGQ